MGDAIHTPETQTVGTFMGYTFLDELEGFIRMAKGYIIRGEDRAAMCFHNAEVKFLPPPFESIVNAGLCRLRFMPGETMLPRCGP